MRELHPGTESTKPEGAADRAAGDGTGDSRALQALAADDQLPTRQDVYEATWGDNPQLDEASPGGAYDVGASDKELEALAAADQLPTRQDVYAATWGNDPAYEGEAGPGGQPHITHYQSSFRGEQLDLWTDGEGHWASDYKRADDALPIDHMADVRSRMGTEVTSVTESLDDREIEVTRDPRDGVWIEGMPGEAPYETGDVLAGADTPEEKRSRVRDFAGVVVRNGENVFDSAHDNSELTFKALHHPPEGKAEVPVPAHGSALESPHHEAPVGDMMSGIIAATIIGEMLALKLRELFTRGKAGAGHASDG
jgi:hypothetical protein